MKFLFQILLILLMSHPIKLSVSSQCYLGTLPYNSFKTTSFNTTSFNTTSFNTTSFNTTSFYTTSFNTTCIPERGVCFSALYGFCSILTVVMGCWGDGVANLPRCYSEVDRALCLCDSFLCNSELPSSEIKGPSFVPVQGLTLLVICMGVLLSVCIMAFIFMALCHHPQPQTQDSYPRERESVRVHILSLLLFIRSTDPENKGVTIPMLVGMGRGDKSTLGRWLSKMVDSGDVEKVREKMVIPGEGSVPALYKAK
jgi:hypothetical protein